MIIDIADDGLVRLEAMEEVISSQLTSRNQCIPIARQHRTNWGCSKLTPFPAQVVAIQLQVW